MAAGAAPAGDATATRELTADERTRVDKIKETVDLTDPNMVIQYGLPAQSKIAAFADSLLADLRTKDADAAGVAMTELLAKVRELDVDGLTKGSKGSRIPLVGRFVDRVKRFDANYQKLSVTVDKLLTALERARMGLLKDVTVLDKMYELNLDHLRQLDLYIAAGQEMLRGTRDDAGAEPRGGGADLRTTPWSHSGSPTSARASPASNGACTTSS